MLNLKVYEIARDLTKTGDLVQWHSDSLLGAGIRLRKGGVINHTSIIIRLAEYEGKDRRVFTLEALEHGVVLNLLSRRLADYDGDAYLLRLKDKFDPLRGDMGERALACVGIPYDYLGIIKECFGNAQMGLDQLFCSETAWYALTGKTTGEAPDPNEIQEYLADWFINPPIKLTGE